MRQRMNLIKGSFLLFIDLPFRVLVSFNRLRTSFQLRKCLFHEIHFLTNPWGGLGLNFSSKRKLHENIWSSYRSTQLFVLIQNSVLASFKWTFTDWNLRNTSQKSTKFDPLTSILRVGLWGQCFFLNIFIRFRSASKALFIHVKSSRQNDQITWN